MGKRIEAIKEGLKKVTPKKVLTALGIAVGVGAVGYTLYSGFKAVTSAHKAIDAGTEEVTIDCGYIPETNHSEENV